MSEPDENISSPPPKRRRFLKILIILLLAAAIVFLISFLVMYACNNFSFTDDRTFSRDLDTAIEKGRSWVELHRSQILKRGNIALIRMLQDINDMNPDPLYSGIVDTFMARPTQPDCWKRLLDPNHPVTNMFLNRTIEKESIDNKWILYAIAPKYADVTPQQLKLFDPDHWQERKLTHQLWALIHLRRTKGPSEELDVLIEHLCGRITDSLHFDIAVVDIYIQKAVFVLKAGFPEKIRRRWLERIIANQLPDGGWNDKWFIFTSDKAPSLNLSQPPAIQHATIQALWLLYQVKYRYPEHFALSD